MFEVLEEIRVRSLEPFIRACTQSSSSRAMPAKSKKLNAFESTENLVPDFNPDALRSLTEKIESNFKNQGKGVSSKDAPARPKTKTTNVQKKTGENSAKALISTSAVKAASNGSTATGRQKPTVALKTSQGKKRWRDGRVKEEKKGTRGGDVNAIKLGTGNRKIDLDNDTNIDEEMKALGGTKEDVDLIANAMSESEMEGEEAGPSKNLGNGLERELLQLVRQLGADRVGKKEVMANSESEEADEVGEVEKNRDPDTISPNKVPIGVKPALQTATPVGKGQRSLVSKQNGRFFRLSDIYADFGLV